MSTSTAYVTFADFGDRIQAIRSDSSAVIGTARRGGLDDPWAGWLITIGAQRHPAVVNKRIARLRLRELAEATLAVLLHAARPAEPVDDRVDALGRVWRRITSALADGMPYPVSVQTPLGGTALIELPTLAAVHGWAACLGLGEVSEWVDHGAVFAGAMGDVDGVLVSVTAEQHPDGGR